MPRQHKDQGPNGGGSYQQTGDNEIVLGGPHRPDDTASPTANLMRYIMAPPPYPFEDRVPRERGDDHAKRISGTMPDPK